MLSETLLEQDAMPSQASPHVGSRPLPAPVGRWRLDPSLTFLNHGSYGALLDEVATAHRQLCEEIEKDPVRYFKVDLERRLDAVRSRIGAFVGCDGDDVAPIHNATLALATIFHSIGFKPGDEVLVTDHEYSSALNELDRLSARTGMRIVTAPVPFPVAGPGQVVESVCSRLSPRTRLVVLSHVTSASAMIFPAQTIADECNARGIPMLLDGAHAPGQIPVNIRELNPAYFVGSLHKWVSAPKGCAFMYVRRDLQASLRPLWLSSRAKKIRPDRALYLRDFDYFGTGDYTALLTVPAAIDAMARLLPGGWPALMAANHERIIEAQRILRRICGIAPACPESMTGSMISLILPELPAGVAPGRTEYDDPLQDALLARHRIQAPVWRLLEKPDGSTGVRVLRLSAQVYNTPDQYERLGAALNEELERERRGLSGV